MTAKRVQMTKMPELVSMFNGMGGACAALISLIELNHMYHAAHLNGDYAAYGIMTAIVAGLIIGSVSFSGSIIAYLKLNGTMGKPIRLPQYNIINLLVMLGTL